MISLEYKGTLKGDNKSSKAKCLKLIRKEYGSLLNFVKDIELKINTESK